LIREQKTYNGKGGSSCRHNCFYICIFTIFFNKGHNSRTPRSVGPHKEYSNKHLVFKGIICSKFHLDDLKSVQGVLDRNFHQQTVPDIDDSISLEYNN